MIAPVRLYCICGAAFAAVPASTKKSEKKAKEIADIWLLGHSDPGHAPCDAATASRARRKAERAEQ